MLHQPPDTPSPARGFTPPGPGGRRLLMAAAALGYAALLAPLLRAAGPAAVAAALLPVLLAAWLVGRRMEERAAELGAANRALREGEERYRAFLEHSSEGIWRFEFDPPIPAGLPPEEQIREAYRGGRLAECNDAMARMYGFTRAGEIVGARLGDLLPPGEPQNVAYLDAFVRSGYRLLDVESAEVDRNGAPRVFRNSLVGVVEDGVVRRVWGVQRDVTEHRRAEEALRRSEEYFRSLIESVSDVIQVVNEDGTLRFVSPSVRRVLGYDPGELAGARAFGLFHPDDLPEAARAFARVLASPGGEPCLVDVRLRHRDGSWRLCQGVGSNLFGDAGVRGFVVAFRDVTERRATEEALSESQRQLLHAQKMEAVGRLAGGVAHDFNNMLTAIKGFAQLLLLDLPEHDPGHLYAQEIQKAADRSAALTRQLLAFSRRQVLQPEVLDLNATVGEMDRMLRRVIGEDVHLVTLLDPALERVRADPGQVEQVLLNLAVNARDAMPAGGSW